MTTTTGVEQGPTAAPRRRSAPRRRAAAVLGLVGAIGVGVWAVAAARQPVGDDGLHLAHQCRGMTTAACTAKADGWLLDRSRAMSTSSVTTAQDFDHALGGPVQGFAEIEGFSTTPVYADGEGRPATAVHYSLTLRTEQGVTSLSRTFCPGQTPRILPGKVDCS